MKMQLCRLIIKPQQTIFSLATTTMMTIWNFVITTMLLHALPSTMNAVLATNPQTVVTSSSSTISEEDSNEYHRREDEQGHFLVS